ncbi:MAG: hypothetical protein P4L44_11930 [Oryzomonas sp.]|uniref:hypothetical protein n=1 Tax=Oryzomonas sp. TaxID=2855186 RepID=UPI0028521558|nr:hypothetical protein [Oryzomonas sp.]MDR3580662.1 hypothetical protein [Oryzomonas sp.]
MKSGTRRGHFRDSAPIVKLKTSATESRPLVDSAQQNRGAACDGNSKAEAYDLGKRLYAGFAEHLSGQAASDQKKGYDRALFCDTAECMSEAVEPGGKVRVGAGIRTIQTWPHRFHG